MKRVIGELELDFEEGVPRSLLIPVLRTSADLSTDNIEEAMEKLRYKGEVYEPYDDQYKTV